MALLRYLVLVVLAVASSIVSAETIPATVQGRLWSGGYTAGSAPYSQKLAESCRAALTANMSPAPTCVVVSTGPAEPPTDSTVNAWMQFTCSYYSNHTAPQGGGCGQFYASGDAYVCPSGQGWTLSGTSCTRPDCQPGETRDPNGLCVSPCVTKSQQAPSMHWFKSAVGAMTLEGSTYCDSGCTAAVNPAPTGTSYNNGKFKLQRYEVVYLPIACTEGAALPAEQPNAVPPPEPPKKPVCLATEGVLTTSSGTVACVPPGVESAEVPVVRKDTKTETFPDGSTKKIDTVYTRDPASQVQDTQQIVTVTPATGGQPGAAGTPGVSSSSGTSQPPSGDDKKNAKFCEENAQLQICQGDMNKEETQKEVRDYIKSLTDPAGTNFDAITDAKQTADSDSKLQDEIDKFTAAADGSVSPDSASKSAWSSAMSSGWFEPVTRVGCSPYTATISGRTWNFDMCPTAEKISVIAEYAMWFGLVVSVFVMFTGGPISRSS